MAEDNQNQNGQYKEIDSTELQPVKGNFGKILTFGAKIAIGGAVIVFVSHLIFAPRVMGVSRAARLQFEQKQSQIQKQLAEEVQKEINEKD